MNFADNWARVFVVITFLTFGEAQIIGGIVPNLIAFGLFLGAIGYFASTGKMAEMFGWKKQEIKLSLASKDSGDPAEIPVSFPHQKRQAGKPVSD